MSCQLHLSNNDPNHGTGSITTNVILFLFPQLRDSNQTINLWKGKLVLLSTYIPINHYNQNRNHPFLFEPTTIFEI